MNKNILFGVVDSGVTHSESECSDIDTKFRMVKEAGVFDYYDKTPSSDQVVQYAEASAKYALPLSAGGYYYRLGQDESLLREHLKNCGKLGTRVHNVQIMFDNAAERPVTDEEVASMYIEATEIGDAYGVTPCFEVHVNMWSENFGRVETVAKLVEAKGVKFNLTLDPSHIVFKMDNPEEMLFQGMHREVEAGRLELDPFKHGNICQAWIDAGYVRHAHARSAAPGGPRNIWARHPDGQLGRGIQYPFVKPSQGEWHSEWSEEKLEPWKEVFRQLFRHHARSPESSLATVSTEFIPYPDYGGGAKYSLFEQNVACAEWLRGIWMAEAQAAGIS